MEGEFKKESNKTNEVFQLLPRKQLIGESLEQFNAVLSGLAARCFFVSLEARVLRDMFIVNMTNRESQNELCRATKPRKKRIVSSFPTSGGTNIPKLTFRPEAQKRAVPEAAGCKSRRNRRESSEVDTKTTRREDAAQPKAEDRTEEG